MRRQHGAPILGASASARGSCGGPGAVPPRRLCGWRRRSSGMAMLPVRDKPAKYPSRAERAGRFPHASPIPGL